MRKQTTKTAKQCITRTNLSKCSTQKWLKSNQTRAKTVVLTLQRTKNGYAIENASILRKLNQHRAVSVPADISVITNDLNEKGLVKI